MSTLTQTPDVSIGDLPISLLRDQASSPREGYTLPWKVPGNFACQGYLRFFATAAMAFHVTAVGSLSQSFLFTLFRTSLRLFPSGYLTSKMSLAGGQESGMLFLHCRPHLHDRKREARPCCSALSPRDEASRHPEPQRHGHFSMYQGRTAVLPET